MKAFTLSSSFDDNSSSDNAEIPALSFAPVAERMPCFLLLSLLFCLSTARLYASINVSGFVLSEMKSAKEVICSPSTSLVFSFGKFLLFRLDDIPLGRALLMKSSISWVVISQFSASSLSVAPSSYSSCMIWPTEIEDIPPLPFLPRNFSTS